MLKLQGKYQLPSKGHRVKESVDSI
jgi:hypothetical protein